MFKILIVEDDLKIATIIQENVQRWGMEGEIVKDFHHVYLDFISYQPHLILLDITLPCYNGFHWCQEIRKVSQVPILFLSSRNTDMDIIMAMNMGADDYITKPFSLDVLLVKIQASLRRSYSYTETKLNILEHRGSVLNLSDKSLIYQGKKLELSKNEFCILQVLMSNHGEVISRDRMIRILWEDENFVDDNTLTVNVNRLRKKLKDFGLEEWIVTRKNQGYVIL